VSEYSSSNTALSAMRAELRKIAQNLLSTFWGDRSGNIGLKLTICEARGRNGARSMDAMRSHRFLPEKGKPLAISGIHNRSRSSRAAVARR
jgi:hypothetical protein